MNLKGLVVQLVLAVPLHQLIPLHLVDLVVQLRLLLRLIQSHLVFLAARLNLGDLVSPVNRYLLFRPYPPSRHSHRAYRSLLSLLPSPFYQLDRRDQLHLAHHFFLALL
ncbi:MAG: hypothetical protein EBU67_11195, partial [Actinobacteria bacterium]|nr:hypothetical protein [Actinomycetota bacterium]